MENLKKLFDIYRQLLLIHIGTKTVDNTFHKFTEWLYELLFDIFHTISEKNQDIWDAEALDCEKAKKDAYELVEDAKALLSDMIEENNSYGMDNLLRWLYDKIEFACGDVRSFIHNEEEDDYTNGMR